VKKLLGILKAEYTGLPSEDSPNEFALIFPLRLEVSEKEEETIAEEKLREEEKTEEIKEIPEEEKPEEKEIPEKSVPSTTSKKTLDISKLNCLYLEDQIDSQILFRVQMKELNSIEFATSLEKALPLLKSKKFDFILMDINLQGEYNGLDALKIIRQMPGYENIPIIAVTAYVVPGAAEKFIQAGFNEFITKPLLREKIIGALEKVFS
jgi:CheY-like chemotaxis protein